MARSTEHDFVTATFIEVARELSRSELYGYGEADRGRFDFACTLQRDNSRQLVGQTLTHHAAGIEKDLNWLLFEKTADLPVYLYAHVARNEGRIQEVLAQARGSLPEKVSLVRLIRYPEFDADDEAQRKIIRESLREQVLDDLLLNVLFGRLTEIDIAIFLENGGISGLMLAALHDIGVNGFVNFPPMAKRIGINPTTLRPRVAALVASGMLEQARNISLYRLTQRARVFLAICYLLDTGHVSYELNYILRKLGLAGMPEVEVLPESSTSTQRWIGSSAQGRLLSEIIEARTRFGVTLTNGLYEGMPYTEGIPHEIVWFGR